MEMKTDLYTSIHFYILSFLCELREFLFHLLFFELLFIKYFFFQFSILFFSQSNLFFCQSSSLLVFFPKNLNFFKYNFSGSDSYYPISYKSVEKVSLNFLNMSFLIRSLHLSEIGVLELLLIWMSSKSLSNEFKSLILYVPSASCSLFTPKI